MFTYDLGDYYPRSRQAQHDEATRVLGSLGLAGIAPNELESMPSLVNLNEDPLMSGMLSYNCAHNLSLTERARVDALARELKRGPADERCAIT